MLNWFLDIFRTKRLFETYVEYSGHTLSSEVCDIVLDNGETHRVIFWQEYFQYNTMYYFDPETGDLSSSDYGYYEYVDYLEPIVSRMPTYKEYFSLNSIVETVDGEFIYTSRIVKVIPIGPGETKQVTLKSTKSRKVSSKLSL